MQPQQDHQAQDHTAPGGLSPELEEMLDGFKMSTVGEIRDADLARQIETASKHPRSLRAFQDKLREICTLSQGVAQSCTYALPRGGKKIIGPSVRFAELLVHSYSNLHVSAVIIECGEDYVVVRGSVIDLESNTLTEGDVRRNVQKRRKFKKGERDRDAEALATAAASAIAYRNVVFKAVPRALWEDIWYESQQAALGKGTMEQKRSLAIGWYKSEFNLEEKQVVAALGRAGPEEITVDDLRYLRGVATSIRNGSTTIEEFLRGPELERRGPAKSTGSSAVGDMLASRNAEPPHDPETGEVADDPTAGDQAEA